MDGEVAEEAAPLSVRAFGLESHQLIRARSIRHHREILNESRVVAAIDTDRANRGVVTNSSARSACGGAVRTISECYFVPQGHERRVANDRAIDADRVIG